MSLFACTREGCGKDSKCWRALRCQWEDTTRSLAPTTTPKPHGSRGEGASATFELPVSDTSQDLWGLGASETDASGRQGSLFNFDDLSAALDTMNAASRRPVETPPAQQRQPNAAIESAQYAEDKTNPEEQTHMDPLMPALPAFHLECVVDAAAPRPQHRALDAHARNLAAKYEEEQSMRSDAHSDAESAGESAAPSTWEGEGYEEDAVLVASGRKAPDRAFLKFMKKLQAAPEQCSRHGGPGALLWPLDGDPPEPAPCPLCGSERRFELQLMSPVLAALDESAEWLEAEGVQKEVIIRPPASWDFATVVVYSCAGQCAPPSGAWAEEEVVVVAED